MEPACNQFFAPVQPLVDLRVSLSSQKLTSLEGVTKGRHHIISEKNVSELIAIHSGEGGVPTNIGGSATNVFKVLAHFSNQCTVMGLTGSDDYAKQYTSLLEKAGICCKTQQVKGQTTGTAICVVDPQDAERTMFTNLGAASGLTAAHIPDELYPKNGHVHLEGYLIFHEGLLPTVIEQAKNRSCTVSLDLSDVNVIKAKKEDFNTLIQSNSIDVLFGNEQEIKEITGQDSVSSACTVLGKNCQTVVATMSGKGGYALTPSLAKPKSFKALKIPRENVIDTVGAGDFFAGAFLHKWKEGESITNCVAWGAAAGGTIVQTKGCDLDAADWQLLEENTSHMLQASALTSPE